VDKNEFFRVSAFIKRAEKLRKSDELSLADKILLILHNQTLIWDRLEKLEKKKCCKD